MSSGRLHTIDTLRGISLFSMILFHLCWDLKYIAGLSMPWYTSFPAYIWQQSICWCFIFISGFSCNLSGKPVKNGVIVSLCGILITVVTLLFLFEDRVIFGVLTLIGTSILLTSVLDPLLRRPHPVTASLISFVLFAVTKNINCGSLGFFDIPLIRLPGSLYSGLFMTFLGFMDPSFFSTDYFSLMPWYFLFLCGFFTCRIIKEGSSPSPRILSSVRIFPFTAAGRHSLVIYMLHQPVLYIIVMLLIRKGL